MPRVVPSQVVAFIDSISSQQSSGPARMNSIGAAGLSATLELVDQIPDELLTMDKDTYGSLIRAKATIKEILATWTANQNAGHKLLEFNLNRYNNPLAQISAALTKCPDESPAPGTSDLVFITETDLRMNLRNDIGAINRALSTGEWKAATVLAGSAIEALFLWSLGQRPVADITTSTTTLLTSGKLTRKPDANLERWDLHEYNEVAYNLGIIEDDTYIKTDLAREYRNLIHPGRAQRLGQKCDRGTALASVAALEHVVRDLS